MDRYSIYPRDANLIILKNLQPIQLKLLQKEQFKKTAKAIDD